MKILNFIILFIAFNLYSQVPPYEFYCDISHTKFTADVSYDSSRGVYIYSYCIYAGPENTGWIADFEIDISIRRKISQKIDPSLNDNCSRRWESAIALISEYAIPVGLTFPNPTLELCSSIKITDSSIPGKDIGIGGYAGCGALNSRQGIKAGESECGFIIEAKYPPGIRDLFIYPNRLRCYGHIPQTEEYWEFDGEYFTRPKGWGKDEDHWLFGKTIGPIEPADYQFYNGGGQKPDDVNLFLKYANPLERETKLPKGENTFDLIIYYGETIIPSTFKAELNGVDITSRFNPVPKVAEVEKLQLQPGRNTLVLSVDGKNQKGQVATDTDRLVFIVQ